METVDFGDPLSLSPLQQYIPRERTWRRELNVGRRAAN